MKVSLFTLAFCLLAYCELEVPAKFYGQLAADYDITQGHYEQLTYGLPVRWHQEYVRLLRERYGIEAHAIAGCVVTRPLIAYAAGYNKVSMKAANRKFGRDIFRESANEAGRNWQALMTSGY